MYRPNMISLFSGVKSMTMPEKIVAFLHGGKRGTFCDDRISSGLNLPRRQEVATVTLTLSLCNGFQRAPGRCTAKKHHGVQKKLVVRVR
jgi:hypothetical protein